MVLPLVKRKLRVGSNLKAYLSFFFSELLSTFLHLLLSFLAIQQTHDILVPSPFDHSPLLTPLFVSLSFGASFTVSLFIFTRFSKGFCNPAITFAVCITGRITQFMAGVMMVAQILGGILASLVVEGVMRGKGRLEVGNNSKELRDGIAVGVEAVGTAVVTLMVLVVVVEDNQRQHSSSTLPPSSSSLGPLFVGISLFLAHLAIGSAAGGGLNPARSFGPAVVTGYFPRFHWVYWLGPFLGASLASAVWWILCVLTPTRLPPQRTWREGCTNTPANTTTHTTLETKQRNLQSGSASNFGSTGMEVAVKGGRQRGEVDLEAQKGYKKV